MNFKKIVKQFLPKGRRSKTIRFGLYKGIKLMLDLQSEALVFLGLYEFETFPAIRRLSSGCKSCIDVGAGKGELSIWFLKQNYIKQVISLEPSVNELNVFYENLGLNGVDRDRRLEILNCYLSDRPSSEYSLKELSSKLENPVFVKIDVDGPEGDILGNCDRVLMEGDLRFLIEVHSEDAERRCIDVLSGAGYEVEIINPSCLRYVIPERRPIAHNRWLGAMKRVQEQ